MSSVSSTPIVVHPNKFLVTKCLPVEEGFDLLPLMNELFRAMVNNNGAGLAANQLGELRQVFAMNTSGKARFCVNPTIVSRSVDLVVFDEMCLSFPGRKVRTRRPKHIEVRYVDESFKVYEETLSGLDAVCFQHEYDHLQGKLFTAREYNGRL